jgi:hypothetical protein
MGIAKTFTDELAKHKLLVYFVTLWGAMLFLWTVYGIVEYGFEIADALDVVDLLFHLSELFAGALLTLFGMKLMNPTFLDAVKNERLLVYFLILWAASFFFMGLYDVVDFGPWIFEYAQDSIAFLSGLAALFAGVVLALFSWKLLGETQ